MRRSAVFAGIEKYRDDFNFGVQTNGTLLDDESIDFLTSRGIGIGLSLDGHEQTVADRTRKNWAGEGFFRRQSHAGEIEGYPNYNVICTVTTQEMEFLTEIVDFLREMEFPWMLNPVRCTRQEAERSSQSMPISLSLSEAQSDYELYQKTGRNW
jgi:uncharacterized protein